MVKVTLFGAVLALAMSGGAVWLAMNPETVDQGSSSVVADQTEAAIERSESRLNRMGSSSSETFSDDGLGDAFKSMETRLNNRLDAMDRRFDALEMENAELKEQLEKQPATTNPGGNPSGTPSSPPRAVPLPEGGSWGKSGSFPGGKTGLGGDLKDISEMLEKMQERRKQKRNDQMKADDYTVERLDEIEASYKTKKAEISQKLQDGGLTAEQAAEEQKLARESADSDVSNLLTEDQKKTYDRYGGVDASSGIKMAWGR